MRTIVRKPSHTILPFADELTGDFDHQTGYTFYMRILSVFLILLLLTSCGFRPLHAPAEQMAVTNTMLHYVAVDSIPGRSGQILQVALEDGLHPEGRQPELSYRLGVSLNEVKQPIIVERTGRVTRYNLILSANFRVYDPSSGRTLHKGKARRISSYNVSTADFATFSAERDARERGLKELAEDIIMRLAAAFEVPQQSE